MDPKTIIEKYYKEGTKLYDIYMSHVTDVTAKALTIAHKHPELCSLFVILLNNCFRVHIIDFPSGYKSNIKSRN